MSLGFLTLGLLLKLLWLFEVPSPSVADNGDYSRIIEPAGLEHVEGSRIDGTRPVQRMRLAERRPGSGFSSPVLLAAAARFFGSHEGGLDIRWMGAVHLLLLGAVYCFIGRGLPSTLLLGPLFLLGDAAYLPFFNSFYAEGAVFLALLGGMFWAYKGPGTRRLGWLVSGVILVLAGGLTKQLYSVFGLVLVATTALLSRLDDQRSSRLQLRAALVLLLAAVAGPFWFSFGPGPRFEEVNRYHAVFAGLASASPDATDALRSLGVPREFWDYPRTDVFRARIKLEDPVHAAIRGVSRLDLAVAYLRDPTAAWSATGRVLRELQAPTSHTRAISVDQRRYKPYELRPVDFSFWRAWLLGQSQRLVSGAWIVLVVGAGVLSFTRVDGAGSARAYSFLVGWVLLQSVGAVLGDGFVSLRQHLVACRFAIDLLTVLSILEVAKWLMPFDGRHRPSPRVQSRRACLLGQLLPPAPTG